MTGMAGPALRVAYVSYRPVDEAMLEGLRRAGAEVAVVPYAGRGDGCRTVRRAPLRSRASFVLRTAWWLRQRRRDCHVTVAVDNRTGAIAANLGHLLGGPPVVLQVRGSAIGRDRPPRARRTWAGPVASALERIVEVLDERLAAAVGATSFAGGRRVASRAGQVAVIPWCGVDPDVFVRRLGRSEARARLGWPQGVPTVLGRRDCSSPGDDRTFVQAVAELRRRGRAVHVAFLGPGDDAVRSRAEALGIEISARRDLPAEERALWCSAADVVVQVADTEVLPVPALEALACGTPVVASRVDGLIEALDEGRLGELVPPGDVLALADGICRQLLGGTAGRAERGRLHVESLFRASNAFEDWVGLARLVAERASSPGAVAQGAAGGPRVVLIDPVASPGGAEKVLLDLAQEMRELGLRPAAIFFETGPIERKMRSLDFDVTVVPLPRSSWQFALVLPAVVRIALRLRRQPCDAVICNHARGHIVGGLAAVLAGKRAVFWQHGVPTARLAERIAARVPSLVTFAYSDAAVEAQRRLSPRGLVVKVHGGVDVGGISRRAGSGKGIKQELTEDDQLLVGIVGRLERWKGQHVFLRAAAEVLTARRNVRFLVVGGAFLGWEGTYEDELRSLADELGITDFVTFTGHQDDVIACIDSLDIVAHCSIEPEPFGLVVVEAMALGKPVIAVGEGGPLEIVEHGRTGLLTPPGDVRSLARAILLLVDEPHMRSRLGEAARVRAQAFDRRRMAENVLAQLKERSSGPVANRLRIVHANQALARAAEIPTGDSAMPTPPITDKV